MDNSRLLLSIITVIIYEDNLVTGYVMVIVLVYLEYVWIFVFFFFFQAEDGIRDLTVTGVQTCALPIVTAFANLATAYVIQITTSIPVTSTADEAQLKHAVDSMMGDVLNHAIAFAPTVVTVQHTRVVGDRIYILLLIADEDGEETIKKLAGEAPARNDSP